MCDINKCIKDEILSLLEKYNLILDEEYQQIFIRSIVCIVLKHTYEPDINIKDV